MPTDKMPPEENLAELTDRCKQLCTDVLNAAAENVHIIYVGVHHGRGRQVYAEINYRLGPFRTKSVMDLFMQGLDDIICSNTGLTARIRCFGHESSAIHARN